MGERREEAGIGRGRCQAMRQAQGKTWLSHKSSGAQMAHRSCNEVRQDGQNFIPHFSHGVQDAPGVVWSWLWPLSAAKAVSEGTKH